MPHMPPAFFFLVLLARSAESTVSTTTASSTITTPSTTTTVQTTTTKSTSTAVFAGACSPPFFEPNGGSYAGSLTVIVATAESCTIQCTTDGRTPLPGSIGTAGSGVSLAKAGTYTVRCVGFNSLFQTSPEAAISLTVASDPPACANVFCGNNGACNSATGKCWCPPGTFGATCQSKSDPYLQATWPVLTQGLSYSLADSLTIDVPAGALVATTKLVCRAYKVAASSFVGMKSEKGEVLQFTNSPVLGLGPEGLTFRKPVSLSIPVDLSLVDSAKEALVIISLFKASDKKIRNDTWAGIFLGGECGQLGGSERVESSGHPQLRSTLRTDYNPPFQSIHCFSSAGQRG